ncbi:MAG: SDR family oxidoreductase [Burkholderiales bacterium]|nr:SDR family oxidoreductase [Burkholderiales bacterium]MDE1929164.1 SDR family oxidoreductase [Burkholderiales bacterium]MDE2503240.1 SDR family oxidoreductase [Burkholderiales bacterium]
MSDPISPPILLVTGAGRGIGAATAVLAARQGWDVALNYRRDTAAAQAVAERVRAQGRRALVVQAEVDDEAQVLAMFGAIDRGLGPLAGLVNNAGIVDVAARVDECSVARWQRMFSINVIGSMLCAREALRRMSRRHGGAGGAIVNVSSVAARLGSAAQYVDYAASKGAIDSFTIGLAREVATEGVRVNAVRPGIVETDIHASGGEPDRAVRLGPQVPMQRAGQADEIAAAICWLLSGAASYTTGALLDVSGGR